MQFVTHQTLKRRSRARNAHHEKQRPIAESQTQNRDNDDYLITYNKNNMFNTKLCRTMTSGGKNTRLKNGESSSQVDKMTQPRHKGPIDSVRHSHQSVQTSVTQTNRKVKEEMDDLENQILVPYPNRNKKKELGVDMLETTSSQDQDKQNRLVDRYQDGLGSTSLAKPGELMLLKE